MIQAQKLLKKRKEDLVKIDNQAWLNDWGSQVRYCSYEKREKAIIIDFPISRNFRVNIKEKLENWKVQTSEKWNHPILRDGIGNWASKSCWGIWKRRGQCWESLLTEIE